MRVAAWTGQDGGEDLHRRRRGRGWLRAGWERDEGKEGGGVREMRERREASVIEITEGREATGS